MSQQEGGTGKGHRKEAQEGHRKESTGKNTGNRNGMTRSVGQRKEGVEIG